MMRMSVCVCAIYTVLTKRLDERYTIFCTSANKSQYDIASISKEQCHDSDSILYTDVYMNVDTRGRVHEVPMEWHDDFLSEECPYANVCIPSFKMYRLSSNALRHNLLISSVSTTWFVDLKLWNLARVSFRSRPGTSRNCLWFTSFFT